MRFARHSNESPRPIPNWCFVNRASFRHNGRMTDLPICTLTEQELRERKATILALVRDRVIRRSELPAGYRYKFANDPDTNEAIHRMVEMERQCCRFLTFELTETDKTIQLDVTGNPESIAIIGDLF